MLVLPKRTPSMMKGEWLMSLRTHPLTIMCPYNSIVHQNHPLSLKEKFIEVCIKQEASPLQLAVVAAHIHCLPLGAHKDKGRLCGRQWWDADFLAELGFQHLGGCLG